MPHLAPWPAAPKPNTRPRRKLRFSIRDLLWLTLVAALLAGWITDGRHLVAERETAIRGILYPEQGDDYRDKTKLSLYSYLTFPCGTPAAEYNRRLDALAQQMSLHREILEELRAEGDHPDLPRLRKHQTTEQSGH
jgi:hypothetical protein